MTDWKSNKGLSPWSCPPITNKNQYNEGSYISRLPTSRGGSPIWSTVFNGNVATSTHVPCGYWTRDYVDYYPETLYGPITYGANTQWDYNYRVRVTNYSLYSDTHYVLLGLNFLNNPTLGTYSGGYNITSAAFGLAATTGNDWDFASTPITLTFSGSKSVVVPSGTVPYYADPINITVGRGYDYILSVYSNKRQSLVGGTGEIGTKFYNSASTSDLSHAVAPAGFTLWYPGTTYMLAEIKVY